MTKRWHKPNLNPQIRLKHFREVANSDHTQHNTQATKDSTSSTSSFLLISVNKLKIEKHREWQNTDSQAVQDILP